MRIAVLNVLFLCLTFSQSFADTQGLEFAQKIYDRPNGKDSVGKGSMTLIDKKGKTRERKVTLFRREPKKKHVYSLIRFHSPNTIKNVGMLTIDEPNKDTQQHLFLPATKRARRISSSRQGGRFVQSDFYFQDMRDRVPDKDNHKILGKDKVNGKTCTKLQSIPKKKKSSAYKKIVACIDEESLIALKVDLFEKSRKKPSKRLVVDKFEKVQGYWTVLKSTMTDLKSKHKSIIELEEVKYDLGLSKKIFARQNLTNPRQEKKYY